MPSAGWPLAAWLSVRRAKPPTRHHVSALGRLLLGADGVKGSVLYDLGAKHGAASLTVDKDLNGGTLTLKATYKQRGDVFILDETVRRELMHRYPSPYTCCFVRACGSFAHSPQLATCHCWACLF
jgi:hypothetical protein